MAEPRDSEVLELSDDAVVGEENGSTPRTNGKKSPAKAKPAAAKAKPSKAAKAVVAKAVVAKGASSKTAEAKPAARNASRTDAKRQASSEKAHRAEQQRRQAQQQQAAEADEEEDEEKQFNSFSEWFRHHLNESSGFAVSMAVHMALLILLVLWNLPLVLDLKPSLSASVSDKVDELAEIPELQPFEEPIEEIEVTEVVEQPDVPTVSEEVNFSPFNDATEAAAKMVELSPMGLSAAPEMAVNAVDGFSGTGVSGRGQASRSQLVRMHGGTPGSENAVAMALAWLAKHQNPDGTWHLDFTGNACQGQCKNPGKIRESFISATSLALLPFLGAGQTHKEGKYKDVVGKGLYALVRLGKPDAKAQGAVSWRDGGNMYAHGLAAIALCEAYAMTDDYELMRPAQASLNYIVYAQDPTGGGWRYSPRSPGDTSVVGWQVMALKSGAVSGLAVPKATIDNAGKFLDSCMINYGEGYTYVPNQNGYKASTSAVGLICRMYMGYAKDEPGLQAGFQKLTQVGPSKSDWYYNYYANQVVFQNTNGKGPVWKKWNTELRDHLVATQAKEGHEKGSWYTNGGHSSNAGRLYTTAMGAMTLEIYYRHMPIYKVNAVEMEFPE